MLPCCLWFMVVVISSVATGPFHVFQADEIQTCFLLTFVKVWQWWRCVQQAFTLKKKGLRLQRPLCGIFLKSTKWGTWGECRFIDMKKLRSYIKEWASAEDFPCFISIRPKGQQPKQEECAEDGLRHSNLKPVQGANNKNQLQSNGLRRLWNHDTSRLEKMDTPDPQVWGINIYPDQ